VIGRVEPSWDNNAIRLTLHPADGPPIQSDVFQRVGTGTGRSVLTRLVDISPEVSGTYQAAMRTPDGAEVGWRRVTIGGRPGSIMWQGHLPPSVDEGSPPPPPKRLAARSATFSVTCEACRNRPRDVEPAICPARLQARRLSGTRPRQLV